MIPKIIHYCWFGGKEKPDTVKNCIDSWKRFMPDYEIKLWNEDNIDVNMFEYSKEAYKNKIWGFVGDPIRIYLLYKYGGIYLDTDVEVYKSFDNLLDNKMFVGFEQPHYFGNATIGAEAGHEYLKEILDEYNKKEFIIKNNWWEYETGPMIMTDVLSKYVNRDSMKYQETNKLTVYEKKYFVNHDKLDNEVYCKHYMLGSWLQYEKNNNVSKFIVSNWWSRNNVI